MTENQGWVSAAAILALPAMVLGGLFGTLILNSEWWEHRKRMARMRHGAIEDAAEEAFKSEQPLLPIHDYKKDADRLTVIANDRLVNIASLQKEVEMVKSDLHEAREQLAKKPKVDQAAVRAVERLKKDLEAEKERRRALEREAGLYRGWMRRISELHEINTSRFYTATFEQVMKEYKEWLSREG